MFKNFIISFLLGITISVSIACGIFYHRLVETRQQLESVRMEYAAVENQQRELREIIRGTDKILCESFDTLSGIRSQIAAIRESYEQMENLLYSTGDNNVIDNSNTNYNGEE